MCLKHANRNPILILGKSFKPETNIITGSPSIYLFNSLKKKKKEVFIWDPETDDIPLEDFMNINKLNNKKICYFIGTQHKAFLNVNFSKNSYVLDPFRYIKKRTGVKIIEIGEGGKI